MALTFTSWSVCDDADNPTLVWGDESLKGRLSYRYLEAVRQAVDERGSDAAYLELVKGEPLRKAQVWNPWVGFTGSFSYWCAQLHGLVWGRALTFVNHTDSGGNWTGAEVFAPSWTEETLLSTLGDEAVVQPPAAGAPLSNIAAWLYQLKRVIDLMRWRRMNVEWWGGATKLGSWYGHWHDWPGGPSYPTWEEFIPLFWDTATWEDGASSIPSAYLSAYESSQRYTITMRRRRGYCRSVGMPTTLQHAEDCYVCSSPSNLQIWSSEGTPWAEGWTLVESFGPHNVEQQAWTPCFGDVDDALEDREQIPEVSRPTPPPYGFHLSAEIVIKYDVPGGYIFQEE